VTVLAIDQGTSGTKALVVDDDGDVVGLAEEVIRPRYLPGGGVEQDPNELLASVISTGRDALAAAGGAAVSAVSIANQGETVLVWDGDTGEPLSQAIVWQDRRAEQMCRVHPEPKAWISGKTGLKLDPYFSAPKMAWLRANITRSGVVSTTDTWLAHHLTGAFVTDTATASRSLLTSLDTADWDDALLRFFGLADEAMPTIVANDAVVGTTDAFGVPTALAGLIVDQQAALLAQRCLDAGTAKCTFGTGTFLLTNVGAEPVRPSAGLTCSVAWNLRGKTTYCVDGQAYTTASAIRWITDLGLISDATELDGVAADDSGGVLFVPALAGLAAPWWRPDATASLSGMTLSTTRGHIVTSVLNGLAAQTAELLNAANAELATPLNALRVDGGLSRSARLMQAVADLTGLPVEVYPSAHATAIGAAACARLACDPALSIQDAIPMWMPSVTYEPRWSRDRAADHQHRWRAAAEASLSPRAHL